MQKKKIHSPYSLSPELSNFCSSQFKIYNQWETSLRESEKSYKKYRDTDKKSAYEDFQSSIKTASAFRDEYFVNKNRTDEYGGSKMKTYEKSIFHKIYSLVGTSFSFAAENTTTRSIKFSYEKYTNVAVDFLRWLKDLEYINLENTDLIRADLRNNSKLKILIVKNNPHLKTVNFSETLPALTKIDVSDCSDLDDDTKKTLLMHERNGVQIIW